MCTVRQGSTRRNCTAVTTGFAETTKSPNGTELSLHHRNSLSTSLDYLLKMLAEPIHASYPIEVTSSSPQCQTSISSDLSPSYTHDTTLLPPAPCQNPNEEDNTSISSGLIPRFPTPTLVSHLATPVLGSRPTSPAICSRFASHALDRTSPIFGSRESCVLPEHVSHSMVPSGLPVLPHSALLSHGTNIELEYAKLVAETEALRAENSEIEEYVEALKRVVFYHRTHPTNDKIAYRVAYGQLIQISRTVDQAAFDFKRIKDRISNLPKSLQLKRMSRVVREEFHGHMETLHPWLRLCDGHWEADHHASPHIIAPIVLCRACPPVCSQSRSVERDVL